MIIGPFQTSAAVGSAGSATGNVTSAHKITGRVVAVYLQYLDSPPGATADVTVLTQGSASGAPPAQTILSVSNAATDGWFYIVTAGHLNTSGASTGNVDGIPVDDYVVFTLAQANANDYIKVWMHLE